MQFATPRRALIATLAALLPALASPTVKAQYTPFNAECRAETVASICEMMNERYVFPEVAEACAKHLRVRAEQVLSDEPTPEEAADFERRELAASRARNFGFEQILRAPGNVGVLDLRSFHDVDGGGETAVAAMNFLASSDAIIVDLRQNGGGDPEMVQLLCSYFFDQPTHLNSLYWRASDETVEFWTLDELQGRRMPDVPLFVLTSPYTKDAMGKAMSLAHKAAEKHRAMLEQQS